MNILCTHIQWAERQTNGDGLPDGCQSGPVSINERVTNQLHGLKVTKTLLYDVDMSM